MAEGIFKLEKRFECDRNTECNLRVHGSIPPLLQCGQRFSVPEYFSGSFSRVQADQL